MNKLVIVRTNFKLNFKSVRKYKKYKFQTNYKMERRSNQKKQCQNFGIFSGVLAFRTREQWAAVAWLHHNLTGKCRYTPNLFLSFAGEHRIFDECVGIRMRLRWQLRCHYFFWFPTKFTGGRIIGPKPAFKERPEMCSRI